MYRGTTPTITINCDIDVSEFVTMWVTFRTQQLATYALFFRAGSANNARNVNTDGTLNRNNAYNGNNGLRPASMDRPTY